MVTTINWRISSRYFILASSFCCPIKLKATGHSSRSESKWTTIINTTIIKNFRRDNSQSMWTIIIGETYNCVQMTTYYRRCFVFYGDGETAGTAVVTFIRHCPGECMYSDRQL